MIDKVPVSRTFVGSHHSEYNYIENMFNKFYTKVIDLISSTNEKRHNAAIDFIKGLKNE